MAAQGYDNLISTDQQTDGEGFVKLVGADFLKATEGTTAIAILTEWDCFKTYDYAGLIEQSMAASETKTLYDLRCLIPNSCDLPFDRVFQLGQGWLKTVTSNSSQAAH